MKQLQRYFLPAVLCLVMAAGMAAPTEARAQAPRIVCDTPTYEFGEADNNQTIEHTFVIRNEGDVSLEITGVRATCGCTATDVSRKIVPPGETAELTGKLNLRGRQGRQRKAIMVQSNDPQTPTLTLYFSGHAVTELQLNPQQIFFGRITADAVVTGVVEMVVKGERPTRLLKLESGSPLLTATNMPQADGVSQRIMVTTVPPLPRGAVRETVRIQTDNPAYRSMDFTVSGFVVGALSFAPHELVLPEQEDREEVRYILCRSEDDRPFEILSVDLPDSAMESRVQATMPNAYRIEIRNIRPTMELNGKVIRITTSLEDAPEHSIPLRIIPGGASPARRHE